MLLELTIDILLGFLVPAAVVRLSGRRLGDMGISLPNAFGKRMILTSVMISIPFGFWILATPVALRGQSITGSRLVYELDAPGGNAHSLI